MFSSEFDKNGCQICYENLKKKVMDYQGESDVFIQNGNRTRKSFVRSLDRIIDETLKTVTSRALISNSVNSFLLGI